VWVDGRLAPAEIVPVIYHEIVELRRMKRDLAHGMRHPRAYGRAHEAANLEERVIRRRSRALRANAARSFCLECERPVELDWDYCHHCGAGPDTHSAVVRFKENPSDEDRYWNLIESSLRESGGDQEHQIAIIHRRLMALPLDDLRQLGTIHRCLIAEAMTWPLWAAAYTMTNGRSDDGFWDFRGWLVSRGRETYEAALADPDSLADVVAVGEENSTGFEDFLYIFDSVHVERTDDDIPLTSRSCSAREPSGEKWDEKKNEDELPRIVPRLFAKFWRGRRRH